MSENLTDYDPIVRTIRGRPEVGRWFRSMPSGRVQDLLDSSDSTRLGGRVNPAGSFPVLYAASDEEGRRPAQECDPGRIPETVIAIFMVTLPRVLDLSDPDTLGALSITEQLISDASDVRTSQAIGVAAYNEGFHGIIYPRPFCSRCHNLAIFSDHVTSANISLLEVRTSTRMGRLACGRPGADLIRALKDQQRSRSGGDCADPGSVRPSP